MSTTFKTRINWGCMGLFLLLFLIWHGAFEKPLTDEEMKSYLTKMLAQNSIGETDSANFALLSLEEIEDRLQDQLAISSVPDEAASQLLNLLKFMRSDDGGPFVMVNLLHLQDLASEPSSNVPDSAAASKMNDYAATVLAFLLPRGSYPLYSGDALAHSVAMWGIEGGEDWTSAGLIRYRSRRVMLDMVTSPEFQASQGNKTSSLAKIKWFRALCPPA